MRTVLLATTFILLITASMLPAATTLNQQAAAIDGSTLGAAVVPTGTLAFGRLELLPSEVERARRLSCLGRPCGLYLPGTTTVRYVVDDPVSLPVARHNFDLEAGLELGSKGEAEWTADGVVIWTWAEIEAEAVGQGIGSSAPDWVSEVVSSRLLTPPSTTLLQAAGTHNESAAVVIFRSAPKIFVFSYDPKVKKEETLAVLNNVKQQGHVLKGQLYANELATQPVGRTWWEHDYAPLVALHTSVVVDATGDDEGTVHSVTKLEATRKVSLWRADLTSRRYEKNKDYPNQVTAVKVAGQAVDWRHHNGELLVSLPSELDQGQQVEVEVAYKGRVAIQYGGYDFWYLGTWGWYPQPPMNGELSTFELTVKVPEKHIPFASGVTKSSMTEDGVTTLVTTLDKPMQYPVVAAGKYKVISDTKKGLTCRVATYGAGQKKGAERLLKNFFAAVGFYESLFGVPYPVKEVTIIERNSWGFGQAPPGVIFITREAFEAISSEERQFFSEGVNERFVHEVAHAWWGQITKKNSFDEQWISEGFASYSAALCLEAMKGGKKGKRLFESMAKHWRGQVMNDKDDGTSLYLANRLAGDSDEDSLARWELMYARGPWVLHALRLAVREHMGSDDLGDEVFFTWMRSVLTNFSFKYGETRHLLGILNQITKKDWSPWFMQYVFGTDVPDTKI